MNDLSNKMQRAQSDPDVEQQQHHLDNPEPPEAPPSSATLSPSTVSSGAQAPLAHSQPDIETVRDPFNMQNMQQELGGPRPLDASASMQLLNDFFSTTGSLVYFGY